MSKNTVENMLTFPCYFLCHLHQHVVVHIINISKSCQRFGQTTRETVKLTFELQMLHYYISIANS